MPVACCLVKFARLFFCSWFVAVLLTSAFCSGANAGSASYVYDELGRLVQVIAVDGTSTQYSYDGAGNIVVVRADSTSTLAITSFYPEIGVAGTSVSISGSGFNLSAAANAVKFNGVAATVSAATVNGLTVVVPAGASTGAISVANGNGTVTSSASFTVGSGSEPVIAGFAPNAANVGTGITVTGRNFQPVPGDNRLIFNTLASGVVSSSTASTLLTLVPTAGASGKISLSTVYGTATSTADFLALPPDLGPSQLTGWSRTVVSGPPKTLNISASASFGALIFDGAINQLITVNAAGSTFSPSGSSVVYEVYGPLGNQISTGIVSASQSVVYLPPLLTAGTYAIFFETASSTASLNVALTNDSSFAVDGGRYEVQSLFAGQTASVSFAGTAGQNFGLALTGLSFASGANAPVTLQVLQPNGAVWLTNASCAVTNPGAGCDLNLSGLPSTGTYVIQVLNPTGNRPVSAGTLTLSTDKVTALVSGTPSATSVRNGQNARFTFSGTAGVPVTLWLGNQSTTPTNAQISVTVQKPDSAVLTQMTLTGALNGTYLNLASLPSSGTYTVFVDPNYGASASVQAVVHPATLPITVDGASVNIAAGASVGAYATFAGTAGQNLGVGVNGLTFAAAVQGSSNLQVVKPDGTVWLQTTCSTGSIGSGCDLNLTNLPVSGTYGIQLFNSTAVPTSAPVTLSSDKAVALVAGTSATVNVRNGQNGRLTFNATAGQAYTLWLGNATTTPTGGAVTMTVYKPDGSNFTQSMLSSTDEGADFDIVNAPQTGAYTVFIDPQFGLSAAVQALLNPAASSVTVDGPAVNIGTTTGGYGRFTGAVGQNLGLGLSGLAMAGGVNGSAILQVVRPDGTVLTSKTCYTSDPGAGCDVNLTGLPIAGTYLIQLINNTAPVSNAVVTLSSDKTASVSTGVPLAVSLRDGQNGRFTFAGVAGNAGTLDFGGYASVPSAQTLAVTVTDPSANIVWQGSVAASSTLHIDLPLLTVSGSYTVFIDPAYGAAVTASLTVGQLPTLALSVDGASLSLNSSVGLYAAFQGTAGQNLGLAVSGLATIPSSVYANVTVSQPNGTTLASSGCSSSNPNAGCDLNLASLPVTGTYIVHLFNSSGSVSAASLTLSNDKTGVLTSAVPSAVSVRAGQNARLTFAGTAGQPALIRFNAITTVAANQNIGVTILKSDGTALSSTVNGSSINDGADIYVPSLPSTGNYTVFIDPSFGSAANLSVTWNPAPTLTVDGAPVGVTTTSAGVGTSMMFQGTAGQNLGVGLSGLALASPNAYAYVYVSVYRPDNTNIGVVTCVVSVAGNGCDINLPNLPMSGPYWVSIEPDSASRLTAGTVTLSSDKSGTLTAGTPMLLSLRNGQNGRLSFSGTSNQPALIRFNGITTGPAGQNVAVNILKPDGTALSTTIYGSTSTDGGDVYVASLPANGTYSVFADPLNGATASLTLTLNPAASLVADGAPVSVATPTAGAGESFVFQGVAGQNLGMALSGLTVTPGTYVYITINKPDNTALTSASCYTGNPGASCDLNLTNLPQTGPYWVSVATDAASRITAGTLTLSSDKLASLTAGTPAVLNLRAGQNGRLTFAATAGQAALIRFTGVNTTPANQAVAINLLRPDGTLLSSTNAYTTSDGADLFVANMPVTGTYTTFVDPSYGASTTFTVALNPTPSLLTDIVDSVSGHIHHDYDGLDRLTNEVSPQGIDELYASRCGRGAYACGLGPIGAHSADSKSKCRLAASQDVLTIYRKSSHFCSRPRCTLPNENREERMIAVVE